METLSRIAVGNRLLIAAILIIIIALAVPFFRKKRDMY